ncbi:MAG: hypothetical protein ACQEW8_15140 [Actinomycetota bacterium]
MRRWAGIGWISLLGSLWLGSIATLALGVAIRLSNCDYSTAGLCSDGAKASANWLISTPVFFVVVLGITVGVVCGVVVLIRSALVRGSAPSIVGSVGLIATALIAAFLVFSATVRFGLWLPSPFLAVSLLIGTVVATAIAVAIGVIVSLMPRARASSEATQARGA